MAINLRPSAPMAHIRYNFPLRRIFYVERTFNELQHTVWLAPDDFKQMLSSMKASPWRYRVLYAVKAMLKR
jgi:hypothetical protein